MAELLRVDNLRAGYGEAVVLQDVSLSLDEGQTLALLGRNGTGKTTLINTLAGATRQHGGSIMLGAGSARVALHKLPSHERAAVGIGWVPQERNIFKSLTVHENLTAVARPGKWNPERVYTMFPRLAERKTNLGTQLSGGEQQMLAIGRALVTNPKLLILDEATEGLAPLIREEIWQCLTRLRQAGQTLVVVDKYVNRLVQIADRHLILERGSVAWHGSSAELDQDRNLWHRYLGV
jgi:branched-chain amino acid transport system ATP-binding protein